jgi:hypothetical protein
LGFKSRKVEKNISPTRGIINESGEINSLKLATTKLLTNENSKEKNPNLSTIDLNVQSSCLKIKPGRKGILCKK